MEWNEDEELLNAIDEVITVSSEDLNKLMSILHDRGVFENPQMISLYAMGVFVNEYSRIRSQEEFAVVSYEKIVDLVIAGHTAMHSDPKMQAIAAQMIQQGLDKKVLENGS